MTREFSVQYFVRIILFLQARPPNPSPFYRPNNTRHRAHSFSWPVLFPATYSPEVSVFKEVPRH